MFHPVKSFRHVQNDIWRQETGTNHLIGKCWFFWILLCHKSVSYKLVFSNKNVGGWFFETFKSKLRGRRKWRIGAKYDFYKMAPGTHSVVLGTKKYCKRKFAVPRVKIIINIWQNRKLFLSPIELQPAGNKAIDVKHSI